LAGEILGEVIRRLSRSGGLQGDLTQTDAQLLERFARRRDEPAFTALLARHGPMVLGLCRRLLADPHEAEDAFQAAFLILARKAGAIQRQALLGPWLYGVAWRVAVRLRGRTARRREREMIGVDLDALPADSAAWSDARWVVHEEVQGLPDVYRSAVVLCCLEGKTNEEAARLLRRPVGTIKSRLMRARELLRKRLARRGMTASVGAVATELTVHRASAAPGAASARAAALAQGVLRAMMFKKATFVGVMVLTLALFGGAGGAAYRAAAGRAGDDARAADTAKSGDPVAEPKDDAAKDKPKPEPSNAGRSEKEQQLLEDWCAVAKKAYDDYKEEFLRGKIVPRPAIDASRNLLRAQVERSDNRADRLAAYEAHLQRMKDIADVAKIKLDAGKMAASDFEDAECHRIEAEILLEREKAK
jgi:RNA polymerase sigma factor (sigma-70 family)